MHFVKLEGLGNDYLFSEDIPKNPSRASRLVCDRHYGVGADGLVLVRPPDDGLSDFQIQIYNADGSEAEVCGNAIRCLGKYLYDRNKTKRKKLKVQTLKGSIPIILMVRDGKVYRVKVDLDEPILSKSLIPMQYAPGEEDKQAIKEKIYLDDNIIFEFTAISFGNPHCVIWVDDLDRVDVPKYGPMIETYSLFPNHVNVSFVQTLDEYLIKQHTWERGVGETMSCGTGAAASVVAGVILGKIKRKIKVKSKGGLLEVYWSEKDNHVYLTGPCRDVFTGKTQII